jgi:uroporphyrinogen-III synthase
MKRVWVTRDEAPDGPLCVAVRDAGLEPVLEPVLARRLTGDITGALGRLSKRDWLVLSSPFSVEAVPADLVRCRVAVIGEPSRRAAEARGLRVERVSPDHTGEGLWRSLRSDPEGAARVLFPRSERAPARQSWPGIEVHSPVLYETRRRAFDPAIAARVDAAAITSPSAVEAIAGTDSLPPCASIGPTTSEAMRAHGIGVWAEASSPDFGSLARAVAAAFRR